MAEAGGVELPALRRALTGGFADSEVLRKHGKNIVDGDFAPGAFAAAQLKDLETAWAQAKDGGLDLPVLNSVRSLFADMCAHGRADLDHSALYLELKDRCS
ncbi:MAG: NAD(P)-dependent oxidoreductase [Proteobacteria bacterium]|nr:NAD(P)-dependent oxidoreductase [Pseudomonadota bacterium]